MRDASLGTPAVPVLRGFHPLAVHLDEIALLRVLRSDVALGVVFRAAAAVQRVRIVERAVRPGCRIVAARTALEPGALLVDHRHEERPISPLVACGALSSPSPAKSAVTSCQLCARTGGPGGDTHHFRASTTSPPSRRTDPRGRFARRARSSGLLIGEVAPEPDAADAGSSLRRRCPPPPRRARVAARSRRIADRGGARTASVRVAARATYGRARPWKEGSTLRVSPRQTPRLPNPGSVLGPGRGSERPRANPRGDVDPIGKAGDDDDVKLGHRSGLLQVRPCDCELGTQAEAVTKGNAAALLGAPARSRRVGDRRRLGAPGAHSHPSASEGRLLRHQEHGFPAPGARRDPILRPGADGEPIFTWAPPAPTPR